MLQTLLGKRVDFLSKLMHNFLYSPEIKTSVNKFFVFDCDVDVMMIPMIKESCHVLVLFFEVIIIEEHIIPIDLVFCKFKVRIWLAVTLNALVTSQHLHVPIFCISHCRRNPILSFNKLFILACFKTSVFKSVFVKLI